MSDQSYRIVKGFFDRWVILHPTSRLALGWSGSRWVPFCGDVQICNFEEEAEAFRFAEENKERLEEQCRKPSNDPNS